MLDILKDKIASLTMTQLIEYFLEHSQFDAAAVASRKYKIAFESMLTAPTSSELWSKFETAVSAHKGSKADVA